MKLSDDAVIADLKDLIVTTVKQSVNQAVEEAVAPLREEMRQGFAEVGSELASVRDDIAAHRRETKEGFEEVNMRLDTIADAHAEQIEELQHDVTILKQKMA